MKAKIAHNELGAKLPNFASLMECVNGPAPGCLTQAEYLLPVALVALLTLAGWWIARRDRKSFRRLRRRGLYAALIVLALSALAIAWFFAARPDVITGTEPSPDLLTLWILAVTVFGTGVSLLAGVGGFALGGWIAKPAKVKGQTAASARQALVIAIDGPAASGKGTLAKRIAAHFNLPCLDTGLLYRAVARDVVERGGRVEDESAALAAAKALDPKTLDDPALRGPAAGDAASVVAKIPAVRAALLDYQRKFAAQVSGAVLDGRDIGTVVCPNADVKIYVTATPEERARRRHSEHQGRGETVAYETVLADIVRRDARDSGRDIAPMEAAPDAVKIDTTHLDPDAAFKAALKVIGGRRGRS